MYLSNFMKHFYSDRDREALYQRWENQFDDSIVLPESLIANLEKYHPKVVERSYFRQGRTDEC